MVVTHLNFTMLSYPFQVLSRTYFSRGISTHGLKFVEKSERRYFFEQDVIEYADILSSRRRKIYDTDLFYPALFIPLFIKGMFLDK